MIDPDTHYFGLTATTPTTKADTPAVRYWIARVAIALLFIAGHATAAPDWRYSIGVHDIIVDDVDSHTYGIAAGLLVEERTEAGWHLFGDFDVFWDHDQDHLDPDHIPIWWQVHVGTDGELWKPSPKFHLDWTIDADTRANTVSSVERQITALPALAARFDSDTFRASLQAGAGYWFLEIDDDAPKERGYVRDDLRNTTFAESAAADATIHVGKSFKVVGRALGWWDGSEWLYSRYVGEAHLSLDGPGDRSEIVLAAEVNEYNFDLYNRPGLVPILPWDDDVLIKISFVSVW